MHDGRKDFDGKGWPRKIALLVKVGNRTNSKSRCQVNLPIIRIDYATGELGRLAYHLQGQVSREEVGGNKTLAIPCDM